MGSSASAPVPNIRDYVTPIAWPIPAGLLVPGDGVNTVAVRVTSFGGKGNGPPLRANGSFAGGLYDDPALENHDRRIGPFDPAASPGAHQQAWTLGGVGWYRKAVPTVPRSSHTAVRFDGIYMNSDVFFNGNLIGGRPYGYSTFEVDLSPYMRSSGTNVLAVRVNNSGVTSRW